MDTATYTSRWGSLRRRLSNAQVAALTEGSDGHAVRCNTTNRALVLVA